MHPCNVVVSSKPVTVHSAPVLMEVFSAAGRVFRGLNTRQPCQPTASCSPPCLPLRTLSPSTPQ